MWATFYLTQRDGEPLIAGYKLDGENFVAAPEEMTTPGRIESIATIAKEPISDVIARGSRVAIAAIATDREHFLAKFTSVSCRIPPHSSFVCVLTCELKNIELKFLPANTTAKLQLLNQGIIKCFKVGYRRRLLDRLLVNLCMGTELKVYLLEQNYSQIDKEALAFVFGVEKLHQYPRHSSVEVWSSIRLISEGYPGDSPDGLHTGPLAVNYAIQILTNMYCNDHMNYNDGTCCSSPEPVTWLQTITFTCFSIVLLLSLALGVRQRLWPTSESPLQGVLQQLSRLGLIMAYFFVCDRTNFFMRENKYYTHLNFFLPVAYVFALGLFFTEETQQTQVLHRDQTDEWKGWMQLVLLVYHMTGASQVLPVYVHVRALVSAYLFLAGYGHFSYFWHQADFGLLRLARVLFRTNLLVVLLCLCMNRPYQFYYFVPLVSFWFLVVAATLGSLPRISAASAEANPLHHLYVVLKFVGLFSVLTVLYMSEVRASMDKPLSYPYAVANSHTLEKDIYVVCSFAVLDTTILCQLWIE
ncbi:N-acetylneuraminate 9-O-acetyltransferase [Rhipicephalus sanguineus]|uniref:N-acetylneuraminate 9-O-acetyltransferase n=1 Tax=Rhipicephalus sanguineus TaxID=34632 RepID=UPI0020C3D721|nr:N-acetylneuraminate 9-O-acetyltransferase [Rhipicephalus sanguineus]